jgi:predicted ribosome quality control (RQC) complex YloA/Tae2 family protein
LDKQVKCIVGRNEQDNNKIEELRQKGDTLLKTEEVAGPVVLITCSSDNVLTRELQLRAASICARYSDAPQGTMVEVSVYQNGESTKITTSGCSYDETARIII